MGKFTEGEVWWAKFPFEEDKTRYIIRPVVVLAEDVLGILSVKITKHAPRNNDPYDLEIFEWSEAGLKMASTARISKTMILDEKTFVSKFGNLTPNDLTRIEAMYMQYITDTQKD